ncbi:MAG TPA: hypothetical protein ENK58_01390 [Desulfobacterales bacterium]|nr:hypothetical protein [Desulfobacterales bacterium]
MCQSGGSGCSVRIGKSEPRHAAGFVNPAGAWEGTPRGCSVRIGGTLCLIANLEVATGRIIAPTIGPTRTGDDYVRHIGQTVDTDPDAWWIFVTDNLSTHQSASLVELIAQRCSIDIFLGEKGYRGILKSMKTRREFLSDTSHRIHFVYTPKHASSRTSPASDEQIHQ